MRSLRVVPGYRWLTILLLCVLPLAAARAGDATQFGAFGGTPPAAITWTPLGHAQNVTTTLTATTADNALVANTAPTAPTAAVANTALALAPSAIVNGAQVRGPVAQAATANFATNAGSAPAIPCTINVAGIPGYPVGSTMPSGTIMTPFPATPPDLTMPICVGGTLNLITLAPIIITGFGMPPGI